MYIYTAVHVNLLLVAVVSNANTADIVVQHDDMILNQLVVLYVYDFGILSGTQTIMHLEYVFIQEKYHPGKVIRKY